MQILKKYLYMLFKNRHKISMFKIYFDYNKETGRLRGSWLSVEGEQSPKDVYRSFVYRKDDTSGVYWTGTIDVEHGSVEENNVLIKFKDDRMFGFGRNPFGRFFIKATRVCEQRWEGYKSYKLDSIFKNIGVAETRKRLRNTTALDACDPACDQEKIIKCMRTDDFDCMSVNGINQPMFAWMTLYTRRQRTDAIRDVLQREKTEKMTKQRKEHLAEECAEVRKILKNTKLEMKSILRSQMKLLHSVKKAHEFTGVFNETVCSDEEKSKIKRRFVNFPSHCRYWIICDMKKANAACPYGVKNNDVDFSELTNDGYRSLKKYISEFVKRTNTKKCS